ncbi:MULTISPECIES: sensor histidine kinase [Leeuwenhoekiella]|jgi:sensor histidine kinase YesM|uniref:Putative two component system, sensor protein n=1 Tax=Leeuwenhoekiella blandensis (strain CECT 7118 / CCUG 51940 / KCTC 22103 / MED217) TaxID=398720 RepID=A3XLV4_LEEBM|nr:MULTISPECIES: histidine kinase [Leeuwenhoekiella]EAQ49474.1 putative two component system, sensor protein [Leeuwenhoekiella blandensis MED217]MAO44352.1 histidine kinase [Leeuwenhoekiella sp.]MBQ50790.1 histidine kinase [Leeuwenhoekiella sp.]HBT10889.1 histidine kinase [Leeuwenhoekiella sp.]|tara:strand:+ start:7423 stop:8478 length:1056 start_codon:yes stop_codon:yes gene_type:complete
MDLLKFNQTRIFASHTLLWVGVWFFFVYFFSYNSTNSLYITWFSSILLPLTMLTTYTTAYYLVPKYLLQQRYLLFSLYAIYVLIFTAFLATVTMIGSFIFLSNLRVAETPPMSRNLIFIMILIYLVVGLVSFVHILKHNFNMLTQNKALENKILDTQLHIKQQELHYLKKQIHPHFLFNTLNTIYGFALRQSQQTPDIILKLSNLLDYILYQVQEKEVSLEDELKHIEEYLSLEEIRFQDTLEVSVTKQYNNPSITIPPMLFLPFVENAFKHGAILDGKLRILIDLKADDHELNFKIKNTFLNALPSETPQGIGLPNIQKRLDLLFGKNYTLEVDTQDSWYSVELNLKLNA